MDDQLRCEVCHRVFQPQEEVIITRLAGDLAVLCLACAERARVAIPKTRAIICAREGE